MSEGVSILVMRHFPTPFNAGEGGGEKSRSWSRIGIDREAAEPLADKAARIFDREGVEKITSSTLPRAKQSMELVADKMKERPETKSTPLALTWDTGEAGKPEKEAREMRKKYAQMPDVPIPGGESFDDFRDRERKFAHSELAKAEQEPDVVRAAVLHGHQVMDIANVLNDEDLKDEHWDRLDQMKPGDVMRLSVDGNGKASLEKISG